MVTFFQTSDGKVIAVKTKSPLTPESVKKLEWLFGNAPQIAAQTLDGLFIGPRKEMITPWSTNAVEITQNMGISGIDRIVEFEKTTEMAPDFDPMLKVLYQGLNQDIFTIDIEPEPKQ